MNGDIENHMVLPVADEEGYREIMDRPLTQDEDEAYETFRQQKIDDKECMSCQKPHLEGEIYCEDCIDPTPWCHVCGAMTKDRCDCGPIASNR